MFSVPAAAPPCNGAAGEFRIPFGKHKGQRLADVPADYLHWLLGDPKTSPKLKQTIRLVLEVDLEEDGTEPAPTTAAVAMPLVVWLWGEEMNKRYLLDDAARKVVADGLAVLKKICTMYTRKGWAEGGAA